MKWLEKIIFLFSYPFSLKLGRLGGLFAYYIFRKRRALAVDNLLQAYPNYYSQKTAENIIKNVFENLGMNFVEFLRFKEITPQNLSQFVTFHNKNLLDNLYAEKKGILALTLHLGNWELLAGVVGISGYNTSMVVKSARQASMNNFLTQQRQDKNIKLFSGKNVVKDILRQLKAGGIVGIVMDQSAISREGILLPFFNRPASTLKSLAVLSQRTSAYILPMYIYRDKNYHHHIVVDPPIYHDPEEDIEKRTLKYLAWMEETITKHPEQWIWTHRRWKKRKSYQQTKM